MYKVLTLNQISVKGLDRLPRDSYEIASAVTVPAGGVSVSFDFYPNIFRYNVSSEFDILWENSSDEWSYRLPVDFEISDVAEVEDELSLIPDEFKLLPPYPNPFNPSVQLKYLLPQSGKVKLYIVNLLGQRVVNLVDGNVIAGKHSLSWNAGEYAAGMYLAVLESGNKTQVQKLLLIK